MAEQKKWFWKDYVYTDEEVRKLSLIFSSSKVPEENIVKLQEYFKKTNSLKSREAQFLFLSFNAKFLSDDVSRKWITATWNCFTLLYEIIKEVIKDVRHDIEESQVDKTLSSSNTLHLLLGVNTFHELCNGKDNEKLEEVIHAMFPIYDFILETYTDELETLKFSVLHTCRNDLNAVYNIRNLTLSASLATQQVFFLFGIKASIIENKYITRLLGYSYKVLAYDEHFFSMKFNCALIFVRCLEQLPAEEKKNFHYKEAPVLEVIKETNESIDWIRGWSFGYRKTTLLNDDIVKASLLFAVCHCVRIKELQNMMLKTPPNRNAFQLLLSEILSCTEGPISHDMNIVKLSECLWLMSETLGELQPEDFHGIFKRCISYVNAFYDYRLDIIQTYQKHVTSFLERLIKIACEHYNKGSQDSMINLLEFINFREGKRKMDLLCIDSLLIQKGTSFLIEKFPRLREQLTPLLEDSVCCNSAARLYAKLMETHHSESNVRLQDWLDRWVKPVIAHLRRNELDRIPVHHDLLFKADLICSRIIIRLMPENFGFDKWIFLCLKRMDYERKVLPEKDPGRSSHPRIQQFFFPRADRIRIAALKVLVEWHIPSEIFGKCVFTSLLNYYQINACSQISSLRKEIFDLYKEMFKRLRTSQDLIETNLEEKKKIPIENRTKVQEECINNLDNNLKENKAFRRRFIEQLIANIAPDGNFYRRNLALELLRHLLPFIDKADLNTYWKADDVENFKQIFLDIYPKNKEHASFIFYELSETEIFKTDDVESYNRYFNEALSLASDIKLHKADGAPYILSISANSSHSLPKLKQKIGPTEFHPGDPILNHIIFLKNKISNNPMKLPLYGILSCLSYVIQNWKRVIWNENYANTYKSVFAICYDLFNDALIIVSESVSEVHLLKYEETDHQIRENTKELIFACRTIREVTLIFTKFARLDMELTEHKVLQEKDHHKIGECFRNIFIQAKHMGVFEEAYSAFRDLCECYWKSVNVKLSKLPKEWLQRGLDIVSGEEKDHGHPLTPFSDRAGTGFLILGILKTDPSESKGPFHSVMEKLFEVAEFVDEGKTVNKMHALIILRFLIKEEKFREFFVRYVQKTVEIALNDMKSLDWGVRNSSSLLYFAIVKILLGVQSMEDPENIPVDNISVKVFYSRYPELYKSLVDFLKKECDENSLILNSVLFLFSKLYTSKFDAIIEMTKWDPNIRKYQNNQSVETRKLAAEASMALVSIENFQQRLRQNFTLIASKNIRNNECHGLLLEIWYILEYLDTRQELSDMTVRHFIASTIHVLRETDDKKGLKFSHHCVSLYVDKLSFLFSKYELGFVILIESILESISRLMSEKERNLNITNRKDFEAALMNLKIIILMKYSEEIENSFEEINDCFQKYMMNEQGLIMKTYCLHFILFLNITYKENDLKDPPMWILGDLEVPERIKNVTNYFSQRMQFELLKNIHKLMVKYLTKELKREDVDVDDECFVLNLLILPYYPCVLKSLQEGNKQKTMDMLINFCQCDREDVMSAVITCLSVLLLPLDDKPRSLNYKTLIRLLSRSAAPKAAPHMRLSVCQFLLKCKLLYYEDDESFTNNEIMRISSIVLTLLEDQESRIRTEISALTDGEITYRFEQTEYPWKCMPEKSRENFFEHCRKLLPEPMHFALMLGWTIRHLPDKSNDVSYDFVPNKLNIYAENAHYLQTAGKILFKRLWNPPFVQNFENESKFMELCQSVTNRLIEAANILTVKDNKSYSFPMVKRETKEFVIQALKSISDYLLFKSHQIQTDFRSEFTDHFQKNILDCLKNQVCQEDQYSVKAIFLHLYNPVLLKEKLK